MMEVEGGAAATGQAAGGFVELLPPNHTLYVQNIHEKIKEPELKKMLKELFGAHGQIIQIVAMKSYSRRGQAFIVFDSIDSATAALALQSHELTPGKPIRINYAKTKSDAIAKREGTFAPRPKQPLPPKATLPGSALKRDREDDDDESAPSRMKIDGQPPMPSSRSKRGAPAVAEVPNKILFLTELPADVTEMMLRMLFEQFPGFKEVRLIPGRHDIAFVEYEHEAHAYEARTKLHGFQIKPDVPLNVSFAKK